MRLLYIIQQSIYNNDGKWSTADSNIGMFIGLAKELVEKTDWEIHALIAPPQDFSEIKNYNCCGLIAACVSPKIVKLVLPEFKKHNFYSIC